MPSPMPSPMPAPMPARSKYGVIARRLLAPVALGAAILLLVGCTSHEDLIGLSGKTIIVHYTDTPFPGGLFSEGAACYTVEPGEAHPSAAERPCFLPVVTRPDGTTQQVDCELWSGLEYIDRWELLGRCGRAAKLSDRSYYAKTIRPTAGGTASR